MYQGVKEVSVTGIDTYDDSEAIENVNDYDDEDGGVRVSGPDLEMDDNNLEPDAEDDNPVTNTPHVIFEGMEQFSVWKGNDVAEWVREDRGLNWQILNRLQKIRIADL